MIRRALVAAAALVVAVLTLIGVNRDMTEAPTFNVTTLDYPQSDSTDFAVQCLAIGSNALEDPVWLAAPDQNGFDRPGLTSEQFQILKESERTAGAWPNLADPDRYAAFEAAVRDNTDYFCAIARENQQAELVKTIGMGLIGLMLVGIAGIITLPKRRSVAPAAQVALAAEPQE